MRFLADENIPAPLVAELRARGHDVVEIRVADPGARDAVVMRRARTEDRVVITRDKDFGTLVFRSRLRSAGVILLRVPWEAGVAEQIADAIDRHGERWQGCFSVLEHERIRSTRID